MRSFIVQHPRAFLVAVLGGVVAATGVGSLLLTAGAPSALVLLSQLGLYVLTPIAIATLVPEREGGAVALLIGVTFPQLLFFAWLQQQCIGHVGASLGLLGLGAALAVAGVFFMAPRDVPVHGLKLQRAEPRAGRHPGGHVGAHGAA